MFKKLIFCLLLLVAASSFACTIFVGITGDTKTDTEEFDLKEGDIIFQTLNSSQSWFIEKATKSPATHVGVLKKDKTGAWVVVEAIGPVKETPLQEWLGQGKNTSSAFKKSLKQLLTDEQKEALFKNLKSYYGKPYDFLFIMDYVKIYCRELVYKAYKNIGIELGEIEKLKALDISSPEIQQVIKERAKEHPACKGKAFEECKAAILNQEIVTPASIYDDEDLGEATHLYISHMPNEDFTILMEWKQPLMNGEKVDIQTEGLVFEENP